MMRRDGKATYENIIQFHIAMNDLQGVEISKSRSDLTQHQCDVVFAVFVHFGDRSEQISTL